jgi:hypothetical protein
MYPTESIAEEALISAWITYQYTHGNGPVGVYICEECGSFHLTSQGPINKKLEQAIASGKIQKSKEINAWLDKMRRKGNF